MRGLESPRIVRCEEHRSERWKNGRGATLVLHEYGDEEAWLWRLSAATVDEDGPFSTFPNVERVLTVLSGDGLVLDVDGKSTRCRTFESTRFPGEASTTARLIGGPVLDLNLMLRRGRASGSTTIRSKPGRIDSPDVVVACSKAVLSTASQRLDLNEIDAVFGLERQRVTLEAGVVAVVRVDVTPTERSSS